MARPTPEQLKSINRFTKEPLTEDNTYVHKFRLIGTKFIPTRFLRIDRSLLDIYKKDVDSGNVVQIADHSFGSWFHNGITLPFGRFFSGEITEEKNEFHLDGWMYMKAGQKTYIDDFTTNDISEQLDAGTLSDSSVSITWGKSECSICGNDIRDWDNCSHWPGVTYKVKGKEYLCYIIAKPAEKNDASAMIENSIVCAGAYPDAGHLSQIEPREKKYTVVKSATDIKLANPDVPIGCLLSENSAHFLIEADYKPDATKLHDLYHKMYEEGLPEGWTMGQLVQKHNEVVQTLLEYHEHKMVDALDGTLPAKLKEMSRKEDDKLEEKVELNDNESSDLNVTEDEEVVVFAKDDLRAIFGENIPNDFDVKLLEMAEEGKLLREELINETIEWGIRADGNDFAKDSWLEILKDRSVETIRGFKTQFEKKAKEALKAGRVTEIKAEEKPQRVIPDEAFKI